MTQHLQDLILYNSTYKNEKHTAKHRSKYTKEFVIKMQGQQEFMVYPKYIKISFIFPSSNQL